MKAETMRKVRERLKNILLPPELADYHFEVNRDNMRNLRFMLVIGLTLSLFYMCMEWIGLSGGIYSYVDSLMASGYFVLVLVAFLIYRDDWDKQATVWLYVWESTTLLVLMFLSCVFRTDSVSVMMAVMMAVLPLLIVDAPLRILCFIVGMTGFYLLVCFRIKPVEVFDRELIYMSGSALTASVLSFRNIHARTQIQVERRSAVQSAEHDVLTRLYNRRGGEMMIAEAIERGVSACFVLLDVDNFKQVNDNYGHDVGDLILSRVADVLQNCFREGRDICMRIGGDEFVVFAPNLLDHQRVEQRMAEVKKRMHEIWIDEEEKKHVTVSMGCVIDTGSYPDFDALYKRADQLLYTVKKQSKDGYYISAAEYRKPVDQVSEEE